MIPKIIHYVWLGGAPKPPKLLEYIEGWKRNCPGWKIMEWGDDFAKASGNRYVLEALEQKKWAFASDWVRLAVLERFGGFYLDTDVEVMRPFDPLCGENFVAGWELQNGKVLVGSGVLGSVAGGEVIHKLLSLYDDLSFVRADGELDQTPNTVRFLDTFRSAWGVIPPGGDDESHFGDKGLILPRSAFLSAEGYAIHHFDATWLDPWLRKVWLKVGPYKMVRFKRRLEVPEAVLGLQPGERGIFSLPIGRRKRVVLVKKCTEGRMHGR